MPRGMESAHLVGHSMGIPIAALMVPRHWERPAR